jgi:hypothetical protein
LWAPAGKGDWRYSILRKVWPQIHMKRFAILIAALGLLLLPGAALASSTCQQYSSQVCSVSTVTTPDVTTSATTSASTLPFTGLDVVLLAAGGGTLLGAGLIVRRMSRGLDQ